MDSNDGGIVLFDEFCVWYTKKHEPSREIQVSTIALRKTVKKRRKSSAPRSTNNLALPKRGKPSRPKSGYKFPETATVESGDSGGADNVDESGSGSVDNVDKSGTATDKDR